MQTMQTISIDDMKSMAILTLRKPGWYGWQSCHDGIDSMQSTYIYARKAMYFSTMLRQVILNN